MSPDTKDLIAKLVRAVNSAGGLAVDLAKVVEAEAEEKPPIMPYDFVLDFGDHQFNWGVSYTDRDKCTITGYFIETIPLGDPTINRDQARDLAAWLNAFADGRIEA